MGHGKCAFSAELGQVHVKWGFRVPSGSDSSCVPDSDPAAGLKKVAAATGNNLTCRDHC